MSVTIRLQNLPLSANASHIREFFHGLQIPDGGVNIVGGDNGDAFIVFATDDDARRAMLLNNQIINGSAIQLFLSSKQEMQNIVAEAQNRVLNVKPNSKPMHFSPISQPLNSEKRSFSYFDPHAIEAPPNKLRIIDYSMGNPDYYEEGKFEMNVEPPRPSEFNYKFNRYQKQEINPPVYRHSEPEYIVPRRPNFIENRYEENYYDTYDNRTNGVKNYESQYDKKSLLPTPRNGSIDDDECLYSERTIMPPSIGQFNDNRFPTHHDRNEIYKSDINKIPPTFAVRLIVPNYLNNNKTIFEIFKGIKITARTGIKIEFDDERRLTGYVYILFLNDTEANKALRMNNKIFNGVRLIIDKCELRDFDLVHITDEKQHYDKYAPIRNRSPYYRDMCAEIYRIPSGLSVDELNSHFNNVLDPKNLHFVELSNRFCCVLSLHDEKSFLQILALDNSILCKEKLKISAISRNQYKSTLTAGKKDFKYKETKSYIGVPKKPLLPKSNGTNNSNPPIGTPKPPVANSNKPTLMCAKLEKLATDITAEQICSYFDPIKIPISNIFVRASEAVVHLVDPETCQKIIESCKNNTEYTFTIRPISVIAFNTLKSNFINKPTPSNSVAETKVIVNNTNKSKIVENKEMFFVKIRKLPLFISESHLSTFIKTFKPQPTNISMCFNNSSTRHNGEAILTFKEQREAESFKNEYNGISFKQKTLEVILWDKK